MVLVHLGADGVQYYQECYQDCLLYLSLLGLLGLLDSRQIWIKTAVLAGRYESRKTAYIRCHGTNAIIV